MNLTQALSDTEYETLDAFLSSDAVGEHAMDVSMLDGFLTAIIIGPSPQPPSRWLPKVWGKDPMVWESEAQAEAMISLVMRHMNTLALVFSQTPENFEPLISYAMDGETEVPVLDDWCQGFVEGLMLDTEGWQPLLDSDEHEAMILPLMLYGTQAGWKELESRPDLQARHHHFVEALPACVLGIHEFWASYRQALAATKTIRHEAALPGRNDPCPCGSGKKFKKCCGDAAKTH